MVKAYSVFMLSNLPISRWATRAAAALCLVLLTTISAIGQEGAGSSSPAAPPPVPAFRQADNLAIITIKGEIDAVTSMSVRRRLAEAEAAGANAIVIEIDTPGGAVGAVQEITAELKGTSLHTIAWVRPQAISGGAIIAIACDEIIVSSNATMGDAGVIAMQGGPLGMTLADLPANERAKITAPLIAEVVDSARRHGYDEVLVQSFITLGVETWQVRDKRTGKVHFLTEREYRALFREAPPFNEEPFMASGGELDMDKEKRIYGDDAPADSDPDGEGLIPGSDQITREMQESTNLSLTTLRSPGSSRPNFSQENPDDYEYVRYATDGNSFLTLTAQGLKEVGFAKAVVDTDEQLRQFTGTPQGQMVRLDASWSESLVRVMSSGLVKGVLIVLFLLCLFIELSMPGTGAFGVIALVALAGLVVPPMMINAAGWWPAVVVVVGVLLILVEVLIMPGTVISGLVGLLCVLGGLIGTFAGAGELFPGQTTGSGANLAWAASIVLLSVFGAGVGMYLFSRYTKYVPIVNLLVLKDPPRASESMLSVMGEKVDPDAPVRVGEEGVTTTRLMPSGQAEIGGKLVDVVAERGSLDLGERVRVVSATRFRIVVESVDPTSQSSGEGAQA